MLSQRAFIGEFTFFAGSSDKHLAAKSNYIEVHLLPPEGRGDDISPN